MHDLLIARVLGKLHEGLPVWPFENEEKIRIPFTDQRLLRRIALNEFATESLDEGCRGCSVLRVLLRAAIFLEPQNVQHEYLFAHLEEVLSVL